MDLLSLPPEILMMIMQNLDIESLYQMLDTCLIIREMILKLKKINIRRGDIKSAATLQHRHFKYFSDKIDDLDLTRVNDISKESRLIVKSMQNLRKLNTSYTNLFLKDIMFMCPPLVKHLILTPYAVDIGTMDYNQLLLFVDFFSSFDYIHYKFEPLRHENALLPFLYTEKTREQIIRVSYYKFSNSIIPFNAIFKNEKSIFDFNCSYFRFKTEKQSNKFDFFIYNYDAFGMLPHKRISKLQLIASPYVIKVINNSNEKLHINQDMMTLVNMEALSDLVLRGHIIFIVWNNSIHVKENYLNKIILRDIRKYIPNHICVHNDDQISVISNSCNDTGIIHYKYNNYKVPGKYNLLNFTIRNMAFVDDCICNTNYKKDVTTSTSFSFFAFNFKYITVLLLKNVCDNISDDSWFELFSNCQNLHTLNVHCPALANSNNHVNVAKHLHLCKKLQNFKYNELFFECKEFFSSLSKCSSLEVIQINSKSSIKHLNRYKIWIIAKYLAMIIKNCSNLQIFCIDTPENDLLHQQLRYLAKKYDKRHIIMKEFDRNYLKDIFYPNIGLRFHQIFKH